MEVGRRRTRRQWDVYYKQQHDERKQKKNHGGIDVDANVVEALKKNDGIDVVHVDADDNVVETLKSDGEDDADNENSTECRGVKQKHDDGVEALKKNDGVEALEKIDGMDVDDDNDDGVETSKSVSESDDYVDSIGFLGSSVVKLKNDGGMDADDDDGDGPEALNSDDADDDVSSIESLGASFMKQKNGDGMDVVNDDGGEDEDDDDDGNSVEFLDVEEKNDGIDVRDDNEAESRSGSGLMFCDLSEGVGDTSVEADSLVESEPQIHRDVSVDSDSCSEESDESVSESEPTSEEEDEVFDEDYKEGESSISESSDDDSEDEEEEDDEYSVAETENLMNMAEDGESRRENLRRESDTEQGEDDENDQGNSDCEIRSNEHEPDCGILPGNVNEKLFRLRKRRRMNMERESGADEEKEKLPKIKKNPKRDDGVSETHKSQNKETEHRKCCSSAPIESASSTDNDEGDCFYTRVKSKGQQSSVKMVTLGKKRSRFARDLDLIKILMDSMNAFKDKLHNIDENAVAENALPLKFRFEDELVHPPKKLEWEEHIDSFFRDLELGLRETEDNCTNPYTVYML